MGNIELFKQHIIEKCAVKICTGIDNLNIEKIKKVVSSAQHAGASAIDICANEEIIKEVKDLTDIAIIVSSIKPNELAKAIELGADGIELGNYDSFYKQGIYFSATEILNLVKKTLTLLGDKKTFFCVTIPGEISISEQIELARKLEYLGIDLIDQNLSLFKDKRVGLITNPTGVNSEYQSTIDVLYSKVNLVSLFAPEHGIRGNAQAGGSVGNEIDSVTGLTVYSLYGNTKEPTAEMMAGVDVLCIDIQDVGARFYTYIYTMVHAMKACAKYNKTFVVFDRPNPISNKVDGNILNMKHSSFVGEYDIITQHGLTIGELAGLFNSEYNINCDLKVIKMKDYDPSLYIDETTTPWVNPSPNMPTLDTAIVYTGTCLFEGVNLSEGRGTTKPFEFIGAPFIDAKAWADKLNSLGLEGVTFRPIYFTPTFEDYANTLCGGVQPHVTDRDKFSACKTALAMIYTIKELYPSQVKLQSYLKTLSGVDYIYNMTYTLDELFDIIDKDISEFNKIRAKYVLYE